MVSKPNLTNKLTHTHDTQPDSRNILTHYSTTSAVRSVWGPFFIFMQRYLKNVYNTRSALLLYFTLLSFLSQLNPVSTSSLSKKSERERESGRS